MPSAWTSILVSLPSTLVDKLYRLVEEGTFGSRSEALRYGARLVIRGAATGRLHELTQRRAVERVRERLDRKRAARD